MKKNEGCGAEAHSKKLAGLVWNAEFCATNNSQEIRLENQKVKPSSPNPQSNSTSVWFVEESITLTLRDAELQGVASFVNVPSGGAIISGDILGTFTQRVFFIEHLLFNLWYNSIYSGLYIQVLYLRVQSRRVCVHEREKTMKEIDSLRVSDETHRRKINHKQKERKRIAQRTYCLWSIIVAGITIAWLSCSKRWKGTLARVDEIFQKQCFTWSPFFADIKKDAILFSSANLECWVFFTAAMWRRSSMMETYVMV